MTTKITKRELKALRKTAPLGTRKAVRMSRLPKKATLANGYKPDEKRSLIWRA